DRAVRLVFVPLPAAFQRVVYKLRLSVSLGAYFSASHVTALGVETDGVFESVELGGEENGLGAVRVAAAPLALDVAVAGPVECRVLRVEREPGVRALDAVRAPLLHAPIPR